MNQLHKKSNTFASKKPTPCGKPKKPAPTQLTEKRVREIVKEEILNEKRLRLIERGIVAP